MARSKQPTPLGRALITIPQSDDMDEELSQDEFEVEQAAPQPSSSKARQGSTAAQPPKRGSAKPPPSKARPKQPQPQELVLIEEEVSDPASEEEQPPPPKKPPSQPKVKVPNGVPRSNAKGKGRAVQPTTVPEEDNDDRIVEEEQPSKGQRSRQISSNATTADPSPTNRDFLKLQRDHERLLQQLEQCREERDTFALQFDALSKLRESEAEAELRELRNATDERARSQETLIEMLTNELGRIKDLTREGHINPLKLLTREMMDSRIHLANKTITDKDNEIKKLSSERDELRATVNTLEIELKTEKELAQKERERERARRQIPAPLSSPTRNRVSNNNPTQIQMDLELRTFYEDISGVVVTSHRLQTASQGKPAGRRFNCLFSVNEKDTLNFHLTSCPLPEDPETGATFPEEVIYTPNLDVEPRPSDEFIARMGYLAHGFTFERTQLHYFGTTLSELLKKPSEDDGSDDEDDEEEGEEDEDMSVDE